jgi:2-desacetyl-2-hydroxyethyl bacteriochlorophyllide A dehydrogenase
MRRVVVRADRIAVETADIPTPAANEALVRTMMVGVCGSDVHAAHGRHPFVPTPYFPGHEVVGMIQAVGAAVDTLSVGQRVVVEPDLPCWDCKMCRSGRQNLCTALQFFGCGYHQGGMADFFTLPADRLHVVPDDLQTSAAVLVEPLATPVHAVRTAGDVVGKAVAILGAGTIGLLLLRVLRAAGAATVVVTDPLDGKRVRARALGADAAVDAGRPAVAGDVRAALGESADIVFDCVATQSSIDQAVALADKGGTVVVVGVPARSVTIPLPIVQDHQIRIQGSATYVDVDYADSMRLLQTGAVRAGDFITVTRDLSEAAGAFELAASGEHVKVVMTTGHR